MSLVFNHMGINCADPIAVERWYTTNLGFRRKRVYAPGPDQVVVIGNDSVNLELFPAKGEAPPPRGDRDGPEYPGWRHLAFVVDDLDATLAQMGDDANITLGPLDLGQFIEGMRVAWISDPEGNIVELNQGYADQQDPPPPPFDR